MVIYINRETDLADAALTLLRFADNERIFLFEGDMGAGKTTLIKSLCRQLGMNDTASSPTYSLVNEYVYPEGKIYHFDFFRIKSESEAYDIGFEEYLSTGDYCFIEWPELISGLWPLNYIEIKIDQDEKERRILTVNKVVS